MLSRRRACAIILVVLLCASGCESRNEGAPREDGLSGALRVDAAAMREAGYSPYFAAWLDDDRILMMSVNGQDARVYVHSLGGGETYLAMDGSNDFGWFGKVVDDGRICLYDFDKIIFLNGGTYTVDKTYPIPDEIAVGELDVTRDGRYVAYTDLNDGGLYISPVGFEDRRKIVDAVGDMGNDALSAHPSAPAWSGDGRRLYYRMVYGFETSQYPAVVEADGSGDMKFEHAPEDSAIFELSDGRLLAQKTDTYEIFGFEPESGRLKGLLESGTYTQVVWDDRAKTAASLSEDSGNIILRISDMEKGITLKEYELEEFAPINFAKGSFSPDGRKFLFIYAEDDESNDCFILKIRD